MRLRSLLVVLVCAAAPLAFAQWQWIDKDGRKVFSDSAPPPSVPADKILKRPGQRAADAEAASPAASGPAAASPRVTGRDSELEQRRKVAASADDAKRKAEDQENVRNRAENCEQARRGKSLLDSGVRIANTNDKGERELLDDAGRAAEGRRLDSIIARDCKPAG